MFCNALKLKWLASAFFVSLLTMSCSDDPVPELKGNWYQNSLPDFEGVGRRSAVGFSIGNKGYIGTGYSSDGSRLSDFWEYDADVRAWKQIANFAGGARHDATAFVIDNKAYVGSGYDGNYKQDFYSYDPAANKWTEIASIPGARQYASAFAVNGKGYAGMGYDGNHKQDFYEYNPSTDSWKTMASFLGGKRRGTVAFTLDNKGYVGLGVSNGVYQNTIYQFNPEANNANGEWVEKAALTDPDDTNKTFPRAFAVPLVLNNKVYIVGGTSGGNMSDTWEYDPAANAWTQKTNFEGAARAYAVGFVINNSAYFGTGSSASMHDDFWGFDPNAEQVDND